MSVSAVIGMLSAFLDHIHDGIQHLDEGLLKFCLFLLIQADKQQTVVSSRPPRGHTSCKLTSAIYHYRLARV